MGFTVHWCWGRIGRGRRRRWRYRRIYWWWSGCGIGAFRLWGIQKALPRFEKFLRSLSYLNHRLGIGACLLHTFLSGINLLTNIIDLSTETCCLEKDREKTPMRSDRDRQDLHVTDPWWFQSTLVEIWYATLVRVRWPKEEIVDHFLSDHRENEEKVASELLHCTLHRQRSSSCLWALRATTTNHFALKVRLVFVQSTRSEREDRVNDRFLRSPLSVQQRREKHDVVGGEIDQCPSFVLELIEYVHVLDGSRRICPTTDTVNQWQEMRSNESTRKNSEDPSLTLTRISTENESLLFCIFFLPFARHYISRCIGLRRMANGKYWLRLYASTTNTIRYERCVLRVWSCPIDVVSVWMDRLPSGSAPRLKLKVNRTLQASVEMFFVYFFSLSLLKRTKFLKRVGLSPYICKRSSDISVSKRCSLDRCVFFRFFFALDEVDSAASWLAVVEAGLLVVCFSSVTVELKEREKEMEGNFRSRKFFVESPRTKERTNERQRANRVVSNQKRKRTPRRKLGVRLAICFSPVDAFVSLSR